MEIDFFFLLIDSNSKILWTFHQIWKYFFSFFFIKWLRYEVVVKKTHSRLWINDEAALVLFPNEKPIPTLRSDVRNMRCYSIFETACVSVFIALWMNDERIYNLRCAHIYVTYINKCSYEKALSILNASGVQQK